MRQSTDSYTCQTKPPNGAQYHRTTVFHPVQPVSVYTDRTSSPQLPPLRLHPLNLLHSPLERELKKLAPPIPPQLLAQSTLAHVVFLRNRHLLDPIALDSNMQPPKRSRKVDTTLRLDVHLSTQRRAQLELCLAVCQRRGLFAPGLAAHAACHGAGEIVGKDAAVSFKGSASAGLELLKACLVPAAKVEFVQDVVEVGHRPLAV